MTDSSADTDRVPLEQLVAFNEEISSLMRAGVPLELGLRQLGQTATGGLAKLSQRLAERMEGGASLQQALDDEGDRVPGIYRAVVEAGLRSGRLPEALEEMSALATLLLDLHRRIFIALLYPAIVFVMAWSLLACVCYAAVPEYLRVRETLEIAPGMLVTFLEAMHANLMIWCPGIPLIVLIAALTLSRRVATAHDTVAGRLVSGRLHRFAWFPWIVENFDRAILARTLRLLIRSETPLHEAVLLAGWATGSRAIIGDMTAVAQRLQAGQSLNASLAAANSLPGFLRWMLESGSKNGNLPVVLATAGEVYHTRALQQAETLKSVLPALLTIAVAGSVTLLYCFILFAPVVELFGGLAEPTI